MKTLFWVLLRRPVVSPLLGICSFNMMKCVKIAFLPGINSPVIFLKYIFESVFNTARSALNGVCKWRFYGKGIKLLNTFRATCVISSVV